MKRVTAIDWRDAWERYGRWYDERTTPVTECDECGANTAAPSKEEQFDVLRAIVEGQRR